MTHETLSQAEHVINRKLGGVVAASRLLGHKNPSTVQGWLKRGFIPGRKQREVLNKAREAGVSLSKQDFVVHLADPADAAPQSKNAVQSSDPSHAERLAAGS